jgi:hypothetical protein
MKNGKKQTWIALLLIVALVMLSGCQAVNGLDLNKVMQNSFGIKSMEGTQTIALELIPNPSGAFQNDEEKKLFELFSNIKVNITEVKQQDYTHASIKGVFEYSKGKIPFQMTVTDKDYTILVEGAKKPIVIQNSVSMQQAQQTLSKEMQDLIKQTYEKYYNWYPAFGSYLTGLAPNPNIISVTNGSEFVGTEGVTGKKIHAEIKGSELIGLTKTFLTNLLADEKALREIIGQTYDLVAPLVQQAIKENENASSSYSDLITPYMRNKTLAVEFAFTLLTSNLKKTLENYDASVDSLTSSSQGESLKLLLSDEQYLKTDILVDNDLIPRKSTTEIMINLGEMSTSIKAIKLTTTAQSWNINKPVKLDVIDTSAGQIELKSLSKPGQLVGALDPKSQLYQLLKYDLHITKKEINLLMDNYGGSDDATKPFNHNGIIMVPARFVVEELDADVEWNEATKQITITDPLSGSVIKLNVGSKQATVNGMIKPLETEAELKNGTTFVPVRFIAESLDTKVNWNQDLQMVTIIRD